MRSERDAARAVEQYADMVWRICLLHLKNKHDAEDIFQDVFLKYILYSDTFENDEHEKAWLIRVTINACKDFFRSFSRKDTVSLDEVAETAAAESQEQSDILKAVLSLPKKYKDPIYLFYYEGYSAVEIAKILNKKKISFILYLQEVKTN